MQKRSLFQKIFGWTWTAKSENETLTGAKLLNGYDNLFSLFDGRVYNDSTIRTCIDTIARHFSKMKIRKIIKKTAPLSRKRTAS